MRDPARLRDPDVLDIARDDCQPVDAEPRWRRSIVFRGLEALPARWS